MAVNYATRYAGNVRDPSPDYPFGEARDDTAPDSGDGTPLQEAWLNDFVGLSAALLTAAGITPNNNPETAQSSQLLDALRVAVGGDALSWRVTQAAGSETLAAVRGETAVQDTAFATEFVSRLLFGGTYRVEFEHQTPDTVGDGLHEAKVLLNGALVESWTAPADGVWYSRSVDVSASDGDVITVETRMDAGSPPREGMTRERVISGDNKALHVIASVGARTETEAVRYD